MTCIVCVGGFIKNRVYSGWDGSSCVVFKGGCETH